MRFKPIATEKAVKLIEMENTLVFEVGRKEKKKDIKKEFEETFDTKTNKIRTLIKNNRKICYIKLNKDKPAIDVATDLGMM